MHTQTLFLYYEFLESSVSQRVVSLTLCSRLSWDPIPSLTGTATFRMGLFNWGPRRFWCVAKLTVSYVSKITGHFSSALCYHCTNNTFAFVSRKKNFFSTLLASVFGAYVLNQQKTD
jgi:hypothetical protein